MKQKELKKFKDVLLDIKEKIMGDINQIEGENLKQSPKDASGDLSGYSTHIADAASDSYDREFALNIASKEGSLIYDIDYALKRIEDKSYGTCDLCEAEINLKRLEAVPYAKNCIKCQEKEERKGARRKSLETEEENPSRWEDVYRQEDES